MLCDVTELDLQWPNKHRPEVLGVQGVAASRKRRGVSDALNDGALRDGGTSVAPCLLTWATMKRKRKKNIYKRYGPSAREPLPPLDPATIEAYENGDLEPPLSVLLAYAETVGIPVENLLDDDRDVWFGECRN